MTFFIKSVFSVFIYSNHSPKKPSSQILAYSRHFKALPKSHFSDRIRTIKLNNVMNKGKDTKNDAAENYSGVGSFILEIVKVFLMALIIIMPVRIFLFQPFFVQGASMEPNFENNQYLIINEFGYRQTAAEIANVKLFTVKPFKKIERQTVVVFRYPKKPDQFFIKRIIGLPGEKVEIKNNQVIIYNEENSDGFVLNEKEYLPGSVKTVWDYSIKLKEDEYFVLGDNRMFSSDSRSWGSVPEEDIIGKVLLRAWPADKLTIF
ncbi:MAG: signal peptidase I [Candidatus Moranbacteria bacterium CG10_big_fil_rev_8_21_14_0_10_35_21]|nr:MAG: signal peptidase I [Candidatus Moranbacteria bacterium CG10_big_fil_rev_8_21_14_0_10_35_21]PJA89002.1 MAG: signal peptidase I [Candidatus Moranbacteria bacterium CG_4_9_14_3_um_filter_36_9]